MNKQLFALAFAFVASVFSVSAVAGGSFSGACIVGGIATLTPSIGATKIGSGFSFDDDGSASNQCTGSLNGEVGVHTYSVTAHARGSGIVTCAASAATGGSGTLTIGGNVIRFTGLTILGTGPQVTLALQGQTSGAAGGQASFATDGTAAGNCAANNAGTLNFLIGATAAKLTD